MNVVLCDVIVCKVVFHSIPPVLWEVQFLKSRIFFLKPFIRLQVSLACDFNCIFVQALSLGKRDIKLWLTDFLEVSEVFIRKVFD